MTPPTVTVLTHSPSPYQVELFDAIHDAGGIDLKVLYRYSNDPGRSWARLEPAHTFEAIDRGDDSARATAREWVSGSDLVVFGWYSDSQSRELIRRRASSPRAWCLWGERPGFTQPGFVGRILRRIALFPLLRSRAPMWGIGQWATAGWTREFGAKRLHFNVPYFSDLTRFAALRPSRSLGGPRRILFSGSLIPRKGADLLAEAFRQVARENENVELTWLGSGELEPTLKSMLGEFGRRVRFLGFRPWSELPERYLEADILCAPSRYDGWGLIVPEGLAAGLPVIATDRMGAALDLIEHGSNGWRIAAGDLDALIRALREAVALDDQSLARMSDNAVASVEHHSLQHGVERFVEAARATIDVFEQRAATKL